jgi:hypothetical protein
MAFIEILMEQEVSSSSSRCGDLLPTATKPFSENLMQVTSRRLFKPLVLQIIVLQLDERVLIHNLAAKTPSKILYMFPKDTEGTLLIRGNGGTEAIITIP